jgi:hypothetical protein
MRQYGTAATQSGLRHRRNDHTSQSGCATRSCTSTVIGPSPPAASTGAAPPSSSPSDHNNSGSSTEARPAYAPVSYAPHAPGATNTTSAQPNADTASARNQPDTDSGHQHFVGSTPVRNQSGSGAARGTRHTPTRSQVRPRACSRG